MKRLFERFLGLIAICLLLSSLIETKLIKSLNRSSEPEDHKNHTMIKEKNASKIARKLPGDEKPELNEELKTRKITGKEFKYGIYGIIKTHLPQLINAPELDTSQEDKIIFMNKGVRIVTAEFNLVEGDEFHEDFVELELESDVIKFELSIEKTKLKDYVQEYVLFYVSKACFMIVQSVFQMGDIESDYTSMLSYVVDKYGGEVTLVMTRYKGKKINPFDKKKEEKRERRLLDENRKNVKLVNNLEQRVTRKPIMGRYFMKDIDLKKKKYTSQKPGVAAYLTSLRPLFQHRPSSPERALKEQKADGTFEVDSKPSLSLGDPNFIFDKKTSFKTITFTHPIFKDYLKMTINLENPYVKSSNSLGFYLLTGNVNLSDCKILLEYVNAKSPAIVKFSSPSVEMLITVSVPTNRFIVKHTRLGLELFTDMLKIIAHLTDLRIWRDKYSDTNKFHYEIYEVMKARLLQMMFREIFDNFTDGQTAIPGADGQDVLHMDPEVNPEDTKHEFTFSKAGSKVLTIQINQDELGPEFPVMDMSATMHYGNDLSFGFGKRRVPMRSMYNQHFMFKRFMDMVIEIIVRNDNFFTDYKDNITPFITDAYGYPDEETIPKLEKPKPREPMFNMKYSTDVIGSNKLEPRYFGDRIKYKLCPILSTEFHDTIKEVAGNYIYAGARFFMRRDIGYCYWIVKAMKHLNPVAEKEGEEERRLLEDNVSGHLV